MNLNKQDFSAAIIAVGMTENIGEAAKAATMIAGQYVTISQAEQKEFLTAAKEASIKAIAMLQQLNEKLDAELVSVEGAQQ